MGSSTRNQSIGTSKNSVRPSNGLAFLRLAAACLLMGFSLNPRASWALDGPLGYSEAAQRSDAHSDARNNPVRFFVSTFDEKAGVNHPNLELCTGTFISEDTFLTALHCVKNLEKATQQERDATTSYMDPSKIILPMAIPGTDNIRIHRGMYLIVPQTEDYDVALVLFGRAAADRTTPNELVPAAPQHNGRFGILGIADANPRRGLSIIMAGTGSEYDANRAKPANLRVVNDDGGVAAFVSEFYSTKVRQRLGPNDVGGLPGDKYVRANDPKKEVEVPSNKVLFLSNPARNGPTFLKKGDSGGPMYFGAGTNNPNGEKIFAVNHTAENIKIKENLIQVVSAGSLLLNRQFANMLKLARRLDPTLTIPRAHIDLAATYRPEDTTRRGRYVVPALGLNYGRTLPLSSRDTLTSDTAIIPSLGWDSSTYSVVNIAPACLCLAPTVVIEDAISFAEEGRPCSEADGIPQLIAASTIEMVGGDEYPPIHLLPAEVQQPCLYFPYLPGCGSSYGNSPTVSTSFPPLLLSEVNQCPAPATQPIEIVKPLLIEPLDPSLPNPATNVISVGPLTWITNITLAPLEPLDAIFTLEPRQLIYSVPTPEPYPKIWTYPDPYLVNSIAALAYVEPVKTIDDLIAWEPIFSIEPFRLLNAEPLPHTEGLIAW